MITAPELRTSSGAGDPHPSASVLGADRFGFGRNWLRFLTVLDDERSRRAEMPLLSMLKERTLEGRRFLDIGSGSGLFSLAARRLGAHVHSFDLDRECVRCALELRRRYFPADVNWRIEQGSALDREYLTSLAKFDVVYSWGVPHHTGKMCDAPENAIPPTAPRGTLRTATYNTPSTRPA